MSKLLSIHRAKLAINLLFIPWIFNDEFNLHEKIKLKVGFDKIKEKNFKDMKKIKLK